MTKHHIVNHILVMNASLIVHGPTSINEFKAALSCKHAHSRLDLFSLLEPPHLEEFHLDLSVPSSWVPQKLLNDTIQGHLDVSVLDLPPCAGEVPVNGFEPAHIIMRVRD